MSIYSITSDSEISSGLTNCLKNRSLEQKFLYHWKWADLYYEYKENSDALMKESNNIKDISLFDFWVKNCFVKNNKVVLISLWCGNSGVEKDIYSRLSKDYIIDHIWVDLSREMLLLAKENLKDVDIKKDFVCADFSSLEFKSEISTLAWNNREQKRVFSFFSNTFWNINHTNIIDTLYDILDKWDQIWLDVRLRKSNTVKDDMSIFNLVDIKDNNSVLSDFLSNAFVKSNIPKENWVISKIMKKEEWLNSLKVEFYFNFEKKTQINMKWQITFLPWESIKCLQIYYYDAEKLINFFEEHNFKFIDKEIKWMRWQFLFEKE